MSINTTTKTTGAKHRRIIILGTRSVGKSSVALQYTEKKFNENYNPTIQNTFKKEVTWNGKKYVLEILDTAGQDESSLIPEVVGVDGCVLVYNVINKKSFETIKLINEKFLNEVGHDNIPRVMVGNKTDLDVQRRVTREQGEKLAKELGCCAFVESSAKEYECISDVFAKLMAEMEKSQSPNEKKGVCSIM